MLALLRMLDKSSLQDTTLLNSLPGTKLLDSKKLLLLFWSPKIGFRYLRSVFLILFALTKNNNDCFQTPDNFGVPAAVYCHSYNYHTSTWLVGHRRKVSALYGFLKSCSWAKTIPAWANYLKDEFIRSFQAWRTATIFLSFCLHIAMLFYASSSVTNIQCPVFL